VDRLANAGLVVRSLAPHDRRTVALNLTREGQEQRAALFERRRKALEAVLQAVSPEDRAALERVSDTILRMLPSDAATALTVCRFCNELQCLDCPMDAFGAIV